MTFLDQSPSTDLVMPALARALGEVADVARTEVADTGTYTYRYANLGRVMHAVKTALREEGLSLAQPVHTDGEQGLIYVSTTVFHAGDSEHEAQWVTFPPLGLRLGQTSQAAGSAISYARRYSLMSIFGISAEDDDGSASSTEPPADLGESPWRSTEEARIHELFGAHPPELGVQVRHRFREQFGQGLSTLPVGRHAEALTFVEQALDDIAHHEQEEVPL